MDVFDLKITLMSLLCHYVITGTLKWKQEPIRYRPTDTAGTTEESTGTVLYLSYLEREM